MAHDGLELVTLYHRTAPLYSAALFFLSIGKDMIILISENGIIILIVLISQVKRCSNSNKTKSTAVAVSDPQSVATADKTMWVDRRLFSSPAIIQLQSSIHWPFYNEKG